MPSKTLKRLEPIPTGVTSKTAGRDPTTIHEMFNQTSSDYISKFLGNFWDKVDIESKDSCWRWTGSVSSSGYGYIGFNRQSLQPHRVSKYLEVREAIDEYQCNHTCDNKTCVNPRHIYLGDARQNIKDIPKESANWAELTASDVREIRSRYKKEDIPQWKLGEEYGIRQEQVSKIVNYKQWSEI